MNLHHTLRGLTDQLRADHGQVVTVTISGPPAAVTLVARALATVVPVTAMRNTPNGNPDLIRLDVTCRIARRPS